MIDQIKHFFTGALGLPPQIVLLAAGLGAHVILNLLLQRPLTSAYGLVLPLALGISIESYEIWAAYRSTGLLAAGNDPLLAIVGRHALDVAVVLALPLALVAYGAAR